MQANFLRTTLATHKNRRQVIRSLIMAVVFFAFNTLQAQDYRLFWKYKDYDGAIAVSVPGWVAKLGSTFIDKDEGRDVVRKIRKIRVLVFQDGINPITTKDFTHFNKRAKRRHLDEIITVRTGKTRVQIYGKTRGNNIRKVVLFFSTPDDGAGVVSLRGKFKLDDINKAVKEAGKKSKHGDKPVVPPVVKIPVSRV